VDCSIYQGHGVKGQGHSVTVHEQ